MRWVRWRLALGLWLGLLSTASAQVGVCKDTAFDGLTLSAAGRIAIHDGRTVAEWVNGRWQIAFSGAPDSVRDLLYGRDGRLLLATSDGILRRSSRGWQRLARVTGLHGILGERDGHVLASFIHNRIWEDDRKVLVGRPGTPRSNRVANAGSNHGLSRIQRRFGWAETGLRLVEGHVSCSSHHDVDCTWMRKARLDVQDEQTTVAVYQSDNDLEGDPDEDRPLWITASFFMMTDDAVYLIEDGAGFSAHLWEDETPTFIDLPATRRLRWPDDVVESGYPQGQVVRTPGMAQAVVALGRGVFELTGQQARRRLLLKTRPKAIAYANGQFALLMDDHIELRAKGRKRRIRLPCTRSVQGSTR